MVETEFKWFLTVCEEAHGNYSALESKFLPKNQGFTGDILMFDNASSGTLANMQHHGFKEISKEGISLTDFSVWERVSYRGACHS